MADFTLPAPFEPQKEHALHDPKAKPAPPKLAWRDLLRANAALILGTALGLGLIALAFEARASWHTHRDWVVPTTAPFYAAAGIALAALLLRRAWAAAAPALALLALLLVATGADVWAAFAGKGDALRDALAILAGVLLGFTVVAALAAYAWTEWLRRPAEGTPQA
ncbi:hypothetical protein HRbin29_02143 [bacterium HR29]|jgi:hypothetical protein|nr:hypothetical protein HRbin29_02143 [bacterium HR29]